MLLSKVDIGPGSLNLRMVLDSASRVLQYYQNLATRTFQAITRIQNEVAAYGWDTMSNISSFGKGVDELDVKMLEDARAVIGHSEKDFRNMVLSELCSIRQTLERRSQGIRSEPAVSSERLLTTAPLETTVATGNQVGCPAQRPVLVELPGKSPEKALPALPEAKEKEAALRPSVLWTMPANTLLTAADAAKATGLPPAVFWKRYERNQLPAVHAGNCSRFAARHIRELLVVRKGQHRPKNVSGDEIYAPEKFWTPEEVAQRLRVNVRLVCGLCNSGELDAVRHGKKKSRWRISEAAYQRYFVERLSKDVPEVPSPDGTVDLRTVVGDLAQEGCRISVQKLSGLAQRNEIPWQRHAWQRFVPVKDVAALMELARARANANRKPRANPPAN
jgi:hypothetical protein